MEPAEIGGQADPFAVDRMVGDVPEPDRLAGPAGWCPRFEAEPVVQGAG